MGVKEDLELVEGKVEDDSMERMIIKKIKIGGEVWKLIGVYVKGDIGKYMEEIKKGG